MRLFLYNIFIYAFLPLQAQTAWTTSQEFYVKDVQKLIFNLPQESITLENWDKESVAIEKGKTVKEEIYLYVKAPPYFILENNVLLKDPDKLVEIIDLLKGRALTSDALLTQLQTIKNPLYYQLKGNSSLDEQLAQVPIKITEEIPKTSSNYYYLKPKDIIINGIVLSLDDL